MTKSQSLYQCAWDLVDACRDGQVKLAEVEPDALPEAMRDMTAAQRAAYVDEMASKRAGIQTRIHDLSRQRDAFIVEATAQASGGPEGFDVALRRAIRGQAVARGFQFKDEPPTAE